MPTDYSAVFAALKPLLGRRAKQFAVKADTAIEYTLVTKTPSPFKQQKGEPLYFGSIRLGKAYVSFHLFPLYLSPELMQGISPELEKRKQGKTCFNFKTTPDPRLLGELGALVDAGIEQWKEKKWI